MVQGPRPREHDAGLGEGHNVLEIGTGVGYSTALACERLDDDEVTSVEVDPHRLAQAAALYGGGYGPNLAVADGLYGSRPYTPYDRIVAARSVRDIPPGWLAQAWPGGKALTTPSGWPYGYARVLLTVEDGQTAEGPPLPSTVFLWRPAARAPPALGNPAHRERLTKGAAARRDAVRTCSRSGCGTTFPTPAEAGEVACPACRLHQPGPFLGADDERRNYAALVHADYYDRPTSNPPAATKPLPGTSAHWTLRPAGSWRPAPGPDSRPATTDPGSRTRPAHDRYGLWLMARGWLLSRVTVSAPASRMPRDGLWPGWCGW